MTARESALTFDCGGARLLGVLHRPAEPGPCGVVIVVGGPQYRVGSHRQNVLLARDLAARGIAVLRFDYRGMGDSDGDFRGFERVDRDIAAAIDTLVAEVPGLRRLALWGLCDGASAIAFYAPKDPRIADIVLVNPWVRTEESFARTEISGYYGGKLASWAFWRRLLTGRIDVRQAAVDVLGKLRTGLAPGQPVEAGDTSESRPLPDRVLAGLRAFQGKLLLILSGQDLTAREFEAVALGQKGEADWSRRPQVTIRRLKEANHTYSRQAWRAAVHAWTLEHLTAEGAPASRASRAAPAEAPAVHRSVVAQPIPEES